MKRILLICFVLMASLIGEVMAQRTISGQVTSAADGEGLPGVAVLVRGTSVGVTTDLDGNYRIAVPEGSNQLVFSFVGYTTQEVQIGNRSVIDVRLAEDVQQLQEVVVTALGVQREQKALGYSVSTVAGEEIAEARTTNLVNALSGRVAGIQVTSSGGGPGQASRVVLRGARSLTQNNQPLFVVDGIIISNDNDGSGTATNVTGTALPNRAADINPEDIETMSVLKGPAAAALYGIRAANGAIIITTKSGARAAKAGAVDVNITTSYTFDEPLRLPDYQTTYAQGASGGVYANGTSRSFGPRIEGQDHVNVLGETVPLRVHDPRDQFFQTGGTLISNLSVAGGDETSTYYLSIGAQDQQSYIPEHYFNRYSARVNATKTMGRFRSGVNMNYVQSGGRTPFLGQSGSNPIFPLFHVPVSYDLAGYGYQREDGSQINFRGGSFDNPFWTVNNTYFNSNNDRIIGAVNFGLDLAEGLALDYRLTTDVMAEGTKQFHEVGTGAWQTGHIAYDNMKRQEWNSDLMLSYNTDLGTDFTFSGILGWNINQRSYSYEFTEGTDFVVPGFENIDNTSSRAAPQEIDRLRRLMGVYANLDFSYQNLLFLTLTGRNDWSSTLAPANRSFFYPSASLSFVFTDAFDISNNVLSFGKVRVSAAEVGNDAPVYSLRPLFSAGAFTDGFTNGINFPHSGIPGFQANTTLGNPELRPESIVSYEGGVDLRFFNGRLGLDASYFYSISTDLIFPVDVSPATGYNNMLVNAGRLDSRGVELAVNATPVQVGNFSWNTTFTWSRIRTEVVEIMEGVDQIYLGGFGGDPSIQATVGERYGSIRGTAFLKDPDGNIVIDADPSSSTYGFPLSGQTETLGYQEPDFVGGWRNSFNYRGLSLDFLLDFRRGGYIFNGTSALLQFYGVAKVTEDREVPVVLDGVKNIGSSEAPNYVQNDIAITKNALFWNQISNINEANVYENNWLRVRELNLSYRLPSSIFENTFIRGATFTLTGRNLFLFTNVPDIDPEGSAFGTGNGQGASRFDLPTVRSYGGSIRIQF